MNDRRSGKRKRGVDDRKPQGEERREALPMDHPQVADFVAYLKLKNLAQRTIDLYLQALRLLFRYVDLDDKAPSGISGEELRGHIAHLYQRNLAAGTIENRVVAVKQFFGFLAEEGYLENNPAEGLPYPKVSKRLPKSLSLSEVRELFGVMRGKTVEERRDRVFFELVYTCGLRIGEAVQLRVGDVSWEDARLRVVGKGDKERRVYLKSYTMAILREYVEEQALKDFLFPGLQGHISTNNMRVRFKRYVRKAGLPEDVTPHTLRHSVAVHYLMGGAPISFVQNLLGHESLETTGIYTQLVDEVAREITLNTENALYGTSAEDEGVREAKATYAVPPSKWDTFVAEVFLWLGEEIVS